MPERRSPRRYPRTARVNELLREVIAEELGEIDDDRLALVSVTRVDADADLRHATVWLSALADETVAVVARYRVRLQTAIGRQVRIKRTPELAFKSDPAIASGMVVEEILRRLPKEQAPDD